MFGLWKAGDASSREEGGLLLVKDEVPKDEVPAVEDSASRRDWKRASVVGGDARLSSLDLGLCE